MPFNPAVGDKSADFVYAGLQQAGQAQAARQQQEMSQWGQAINGIASNLEKAGSAYLGNIAKQRANLGKLEAIGAMKLLPEDQLDALSAIKDPDKLAGALAVVEDGMQLQASRTLMQDKAKLQAQLEASGPPDRTGQTSMITDPVTGKQIGVFYQNNKQVVPFPVDPAQNPQAGIQQVDLGNGLIAYVDSKGRPVPKSAVMEANADPITKTKVTALQGDIASLQGEVAKRGADAKNGPNWWPWTETLGTQLKGKETELKSLQGGGQPAATAAPTYNSAADVKAAMRAGTITRDQAAQILREKFGMQ